MPEPAVTRGPPRPGPPERGMGQVQAFPVPPAGLARRLAALDQFRGLAILMIVFLHSGRTYFFRGGHPLEDDSNAVFALNDTLFHNATVYFTMISGIVYAHALWRKGRWKFLSGRIRNVLLPYVVVSVGLTLLVAWAGRSHDSARTLPGQIVHNVLFGEAIYVLWYIPVILFLYLISPLLLWIVRDARLRWLTVLLSLMPLVFSREGTDLTVWTILYFTGAYVVALVIGSDLDRWIDWATRRQRLLWGISLAATVIVFLMYRHNILDVGITDLRETMFYIQRIASGIAIVALLARVRPIASAGLKRALCWIADMAFAVYFLHALIIRIILKGLRVILGDDGMMAYPLLAIPVIFVLSLGLCCLLVVTVRVVAGRYSRLLIGA
ncbi:acyltransferase [Paracoccus benzoatiresistens]|uniref:Acyltransferase n=1 Tax=Paracoccus benzoatiresistens TaxID=2997341 RepID=A0ABT4J0H7_9RHOB|nr:acyltransferase [Paracoccus sp. EF6]MCZ0960622.1 acyltransferase [Paracoccus sp. EF6]